MSLLYDLLILFMIYSIIGWIWETPYVSIKQKQFINRGFLHGPMIPIYGFGSVTIMTSMELFSQYLVLDKWYMAILAIIYIAVIATLWEYVTSLLLEKIFSTRWWDYTEHKYNINGRIAFDVSVGWGIGGFILWRYINTPLMELINNFSANQLNVIIAIFYTILVLDAFVTVKELISLHQIMNKLNMLSDELSGKVVYNIERLNFEIEIRREQLRKTTDEAKEELKKIYDDKREDIKESIDSKKQELSENVLELIERSEITLSEKQKATINKFNKLLERSTGVARFYRNYPKAKSYKFKNIISAVRYKNNEK